MRVIKVLVGVIVTFVVFGTLAWTFYLDAAWMRARAGAGFVAQQACSCVHVTGRSLEQCRGDFLEDTSPIRIRIEPIVREGQVPVETIDPRQQKQPALVHASTLWGMVNATAQYEPGFGCRLVPKPD